MKLICIRDRHFLSGMIKVGEIIEVYPVNPNIYAVPMDPLGEPYYDVYYDGKIFDSYCGNFSDCFITLAEHRDKQIEEILK